MSDADDSDADSSRSSTSLMHSSVKEMLDEQANNHGCVKNCMIMCCSHEMVQQEKLFKN